MPELINIETKVVIQVKDTSRMTHAERLVELESRFDYELTYLERKMKEVKAHETESDQSESSITSNVRIPENFTPKQVEVTKGYIRMKALVDATPGADCTIGERDGKQYVFFVYRTPGKSMPEIKMAR